MPCVEVEDFRYPSGWMSGPGGSVQARRHCEQLENSEVLLFPDTPFDLPEADRAFLIGLRQGDSRYHKNISYRPQRDQLRGFSSPHADSVAQLHRIMRNYSAQVTRFLTTFLAPYAPHWSLDFASFRPVEEEGRDLPLHKRNDLLHVDAFPSRPTRGARILRVFTNINPTQPRVWETGDRFDVLARQYAEAAGLAQLATRAASPAHAFQRRFASFLGAVGMRGMDRPAYDAFMLRFHDFLKESSEFQQNGARTHHEFPPHSTWIVFTDAVPHAALSGQFALEQTYFVPTHALLAPEKSPLRVLEGLCGRALVE
jgi:hypothetical protein